MMYCLVDFFCDAKSKATSHPTFFFKDMINHRKCTEKKEAHDNAPLDARETGLEPATSSVTG